MPGGPRHAADRAIVALLAQGVPSAQVAAHTNVSVRTVDRRRHTHRALIEAERDRAATDLRAAFVAAGTHALALQLRLITTDTVPAHVRANVAGQVARNAATILAREPAAPAVAAADDVLDARAVLNDRIGAIVARIAPPAEAEDEAPPVRLALASGEG